MTHGRKRRNDVRRRKRQRGRLEWRVSVSCLTSWEWDSKIKIVDRSGAFENRLIEYKFNRIISIWLEVRFSFPQKECPRKKLLSLILWVLSYFTWLKKWICFLSHLHFYLTKQRLDSGGCALCGRPTSAVGGLLFNCLDKCTKIKIATISNPRVRYFSS